MPPEPPLSGDVLTDHYLYLLTREPGRSWGEATVGPPLPLPSDRQEAILGARDERTKASTSGEDTAAVVYSSKEQFFWCWDHKSEPGQPQVVRDSSGDGQPIRFKLVDCRPQTHQE